MNKKAQIKSEEQEYLAKDPGEFAVAPNSENEGEIPMPFTGGAHTRSDQTMEQLDEALHASGGEVITEDEPDDDDADDPGQA